jgi:hypothetical protein
LEALNLPSFEWDLRIIEQKKFIFDRVRKKIIPLTPEEWVRQHCVSFLIEYLQISPNLIAIERQIRYLGNPKRFDIVSFNANGHPKLLVECKAPSVKLSPRIITQAGQYLQKIDCEYLWLSNGMEHVWMHKTDGIYREIDFPTAL